MSKRNKLYNYLVNTYGLSKEKIMEYVDARVEDVIAKHIPSLLNSNKVETMIVNQVSDFIKNGPKDHRIWGSRRDFNQIINEQIETIIRKYLKENGSITMEFGGGRVRGDIGFKKEKK